MKSQGFFIQGFVLLSLFVASWGDRGSCFMTCLTGLPQTREGIALEIRDHVHRLSDPVQAS